MRETYCGRCRKTGVRHTFYKCPEWEPCLYCTKKGHYSAQCTKAHSLCYPDRCIVPWYHSQHGTWCNYASSTLSYRTIIRGRVAFEEQEAEQNANTGDPYDAHDFGDAMLADLLDYSD